MLLHQMALASYKSAGVTPLTITFQSSTSSGTDTASHSFASQAIGTATADRIVIVAWGAVNVTIPTTNALSSATIGGVAATILTQQNNNAASTGNISGIIAAAVPTGTTATVALTFNAAQLRCGIATYSMTGGSITPYATYTNSNGTDTVPDLTVTVPAGGGHVAGVYGYSGTGTATVSWTTLTEGADMIVEAADTFSSAYSNSTPGFGPTNLTATFSNGTITRQSMTGVSFSPL